MHSPKRDFNNQEKLNFDHQMILVFAQNLNKFLNSFKENQILATNQPAVTEIEDFQKDLQKKLSSYTTSNTPKNWKQLWLTMQKFNINFKKLGIKEEQKEIIFSLWKDYIKNVWNDPRLLEQIKILEESGNTFYIAKDGINLNSTQNPNEEDRKLSRNLSTAPSAREDIVKSIMNAAKKRSQDSLNMNYGIGNPTITAFRLQKAGGFEFKGEISEETLPEIQEHLHLQQIIEVGRQLIETGTSQQDVYDIFNVSCLIKIGVPSEKFAKDPEYRNTILTKMGCKLDTLQNNPAIPARFIIIESDSHVGPDNIPLYSPPEHAVMDKEGLDKVIQGIQSSQRRMPQTTFPVFDGSGNFRPKYVQSLPTQTERLKQQLKAKEKEVEDLQELLDAFMRESNRPQTAKTTLRRKRILPNKLQDLDQIAESLLADGPTQELKDYRTQTELKKPNYLNPTVSSTHKAQNAGGTGVKFVRLLRKANPPSAAPLAQDNRTITEPIKRRLIRRRKG